MVKLLKISFSVMIIAVMLIPTFIWFRKNEAFVIRAVKIQGNQFVPDEQILDAAEINYSKDIFAVNTDEIEVRILTHPMIERVSVRRLLPSTLKIKVTERNLIAALAGSEVSAVDFSGNIITNYPAESVYDLPVITGFHFKTEVKGVRKPIQPELLQEAFTILYHLKSLDIILYHDISELHYSPSSGIILYFKKTNLPVILGKDDFNRKIAYLSTVYHYLVEKNSLDKALAIDVRFKDQVVVKHKS